MMPIAIKEGNRQTDRPRLHRVRGRSHAIAARRRHAANNLGSFSAAEAVWIKSAAALTVTGPHPNDFAAVVRYVAYKTEEQSVSPSLRCGQKDICTIALHCLCGIVLSNNLHLMLTK